MSNLKVGLDVSAVPEKPAGAGRYVFELAKHFEKSNSAELIAFSRRRDHRWSHMNGLSRVIDSAPNNRPLRLAWEQLKLPGLLKNQNIDVLHSPHYTMPRRTRIARVVTVHDMTFFDFPSFHERTKVNFFQRAIKYAAKNADAVVCVSEDTKEALTKRFDVRGKLEVIGHGVDTNLFSPEPVDGELTTVKQYSDRPYILFVGTLEPRKGVEELVRAFDLFAAKSPDVNLVLVGQWGWHCDEIKQAIDTAKYSDQIVVAGYIPDSDLAALYRHSELVAYPSRYEGFGLPVLEAMSCGSRIVTTNLAAHGQMSKEIAFQSDSATAGDLAKTMSEAIGASKSEWKKRRDAGLKLAAEQSWEAISRRYLQLYASLV